MLPNNPEPRTVAASRPRRVASALWRLFTDGDPVVALVCLGIIVWYVATRGIFQGKASGDGFFGFMYLPGLVFHHTFDIGPNVPQWVPYLGHEKTGHVANACPVGPIVFWFPPYLIGLAIEAIGRLITNTRAGGLPGQSAFDFWMAGLGSLLAGLAGIGILFRLLKRKVGVGAARAGIIGGVLCTPIVFYLVTQPLYQHATAFFCVTLFVERWDRYRSKGELTIRDLAILGALGGFAMDMRIQEAIFLLLPGIDVVGQILRALRDRKPSEAARHVGGGLVLAIAAVIAFSPQLGLWHWYFDSIRTPQPSGHMRWLDPALVATLFGMRAGIFPWMPVFYLVIPGVLLGRRALGNIGVPLLMLFCVELWVNASAWDHWGSWAFGPRRFTDATVTFSAGVAGLWWWTGERGWRLANWRARHVVTALLTFFLLYNVLLAELVRQQKVKSSGSLSYPGSQWVAFAQGPKWLGKALDTVGYPFVQPAGWIFALVHHAPVRAFEGIVGNYLIERDCRIHGVVHIHGFTFNEPGQYVVEGIAGVAAQGDPAKLVPVAEQVRVLVPMFSAEPLRIVVGGDYGKREGEVRAEWNGAPLKAIVAPRSISFDVPKEQVRSRSRTNELTLHVPPGTKLGNLDLQSVSDWWR